MVSLSLSRGHPQERAMGLLEPGHYGRLQSQFPSFHYPKLRTQDRLSMYSQELETSVPQDQLVFAREVWLPKERLHLDIKRVDHAIIAGFGVQGLNTLAGVAGPLLDLFFVRADMTRQEIVATKSVTQALSHLVKVGFWTVPVVTAAGWGAMPPWWLIAAAIPMSMTGTRLGKIILE